MRSMARNNRPVPNAGQEVPSSLRARAARLPAEELRAGEAPAGGVPLEETADRPGQTAETVETGPEAERELGRELEREAMEILRQQRAIWQELDRALRPAPRVRDAYGDDAAGGERVSVRV